MTTYGYDGAGNLTVENAAGSMTTNLWSVDNRLVKTTLPSAAVTTMLYKPLRSGDDPRLFITAIYDADDPKIIGNLVRARLITGDKSGDLRTMISDLARYHPDPAWQQWAHDEVELGKFDPADGLNRPMPVATPEVLPSPIREPELLEPQLEFPEGVLPGEG